MQRRQSVFESQFEAVAGFERNEGRAIAVTAVTLVLRRRDHTRGTAAGNDLLSFHRILQRISGCANTGIVMRQRLFQLRLKVGNTTRWLSTECSSRDKHKDEEKVPVLNRLTIIFCNCSDYGKIPQGLVPIN